MAPDPAVGFGLLTAGGAGTADFLAKTATDRVGFLSTLWYLETFGAPVAVGLALVVDGIGPLPLAPLLGLILLGLLSLLGLLFLYRAFELGRLAIVAPLTSGYPVLTVLMAAVVLRESVTQIEVLGILAVLGGAVLIAARPTRSAGRAKDPKGGLIAAGLAFVAFGVYYFGLHFVIGPIPPVTGAAVTRLVGAAVATAAVAQRHLLRAPPSGLRLRAVGFPTIDTLSLVTFNLGLTLSSSLAVLVTVSGLYGAVTLAWAVLALKDRPTRPQWAGAVLLFAGIALLSWGGA